MPVTRQPSFNRRWASARPMPDALPVMTQWRPAVRGGTVPSMQCGQALFQGAHVFVVHQLNDVFDAHGQVGRSTGKPVSMTPRIAASACCMPWMAAAGNMRGTLGRGACRERGGTEVENPGGA